MVSATSARTAARANFRSAFRGEVLDESHPGYDDARRVWNGAIDRRPRLVARCADPDDVATALRHASDEGLEVAVRGGGHSFPGLSTVDDGIVVDLSPMHDVAVDRTNATARVGAGTLLGQLDAATQRHGLAVPTGAVSHTGVAGLTLGGGIGWLMRRHGLTIDQLRSVDLVTADGDVVAASEEENPELFWGVRGGGGNFGVVTEFTFSLVPVGPVVLSGLVLWPLGDAPDVARAYREWCGDLPDEMTTALVLRRAPAVDGLPPERRGDPVVGVLACWCGDLAMGDRAWAPMRGFGHPLVDLTDHRPFVEHQAMLDASYPHGRWVHMRSCDVAELSDAVLATLVEHAGRIRSVHSGVVAWQAGGAVARRDPASTAFGNRAAGFIVNITGQTEGRRGFSTERDWVRAFGDDLALHDTGVYVNFLMDEGEDRVRHAYGAQRHARLRALKQTWDPENVLHRNQNIRP